MLIKILLSFIVLSPLHGSKAYSADCSQVPPLAIENYDWPHLRQALTEIPAPLASVENALCALPKELGSPAHVPVMMVRSRSLQASTPEAPRAIFAPPWEGPQSDQLFLSFSGDPYLTGGNHIEIFRYLPSNPPGEQTEMIDISFDSGLKITTGSPVKCQKCHGIEPRFLWNERDFWPGAADGRSTQRTEQEFHHMIDSIQNNARYKKIQAFDLAQHFGQLSDFNSDAVKINSTRLLNKVLESPDYSQYKFAIAGAVAGCSPIREFIPTSLRPFHQSRQFLDPIDVARGKELVKKEQSKLKEMLKNGVFSPNHVPVVNSVIQKSQYYLQKSDLESQFLFEMVAIEKEKEQLGKDRPFLLSQVSMPYSTNIRYVFEGRGIGVSDWSYDILEGTYMFDIIDMTTREQNLLKLLHEADSDLQIAEASFMKPFDVEVAQKVFDSVQTAKHKRLCDAYKRKSLQRLQDFTPQPLEHERVADPLAQKNWKHHFTNRGKVESLPYQLPTTNRNSKSCNQCHFGYSANYTGPGFTRQNKKYPLSLMTCANCHSDEENLVAPFIPFHNQADFEEFANTGYGEIIAQRLSDEAKMTLDHMPPILRLKPTQKKAILDYLRSLE